MLTLLTFQPSILWHGGVQGEEGMRVGRQCVVPQLLAGILPLAGQGALSAMLHSICADSPEGPAWALVNVQVCAQLAHKAGCCSSVLGEVQGR